MSSANNFMNTSTHPSNTHTSTTDTAGPHNSNIANKLDPRVDSDRDGRAGGMGATNTHTAGGFGSQHQPGATSTYGTSTNAGPHDSNIANKLDPRVDSDRDGRAQHGTTTGGAFGSSNTHNTYGTTTNAGPHNSNVANKLDPRVDSDRDGRGAHGTTMGGTHGTSTNAGPHDSNVANKLDPRVDSDRDNRGAHQGHEDTYLSSGKMHTNVLGNEAQTTAPASSTHKSSAGVFGATTHGSNTHGTHGTHGTHNTSTNAGPHDSNVANKLDPRVDSDRDGRGAHGTTMGGTHGTSTNAGPHDSNAANKLDPRVDSDRDGRGAHGTTHNTTSNTGGTNTLGKIPMVDNHGHSTASHARTTPTSKSNLPGPAPNTAGPHKSDILNKLDPRVDSNMDGSKTIGGDKTHAI